jgi:glycosyltransferase involved in cell wall biosynthesis
MTSVLVYAPYTVNGQGPGYSCISIAANLTHGLIPEVFAERIQLSYPAQGFIHPTITSPLRHVPWRLVRKRVQGRLNADFAAALDRADPATTVAYFWPEPPIELIRHAKRLGIPTFREMINGACATSLQILDTAYSRLGWSPDHSITPQGAAAEIKTLHEYDFIFASNREVEKSLKLLGISDEVILPTTFGWDEPRFACSDSLERRSALRFVFVGTLCVRKGLPDLLEAWRQANVDGELVLAGKPEGRAITTLVRAHTRSGRVRALGYVRDVGRLLRSADVFVLPTLEEGGPQVTYEAAGCGLPVITTAQGAARIIVDGTNGLIVDPGSIPQLVDAIRLLAGHPELRSRLGAAAKRDAQQFTYQRVGAHRSELMNQSVARFRGLEPGDAGRKDTG